jgi:hypothetical protein
MRHKLMLILVLILALSALAACGGGGGSASSIWPDVPTPPGAEKSDIRLPLPMRLLIQTAVRASARGENVDVDKFDFVGYTTTQSPQQVAEFYSTERMSEAGWNAAEGMNCNAAMTEQGSGGGFCMFAKEDGNQQSLLLITTARGDNDRETNIFFVRFDGQFSGQ